VSERGVTQRVATSLAHYRHHHSLPSPSLTAICHLLVTALLLLRSVRYETTKRILSPQNALLDRLDDLEAAIERKRAAFAAKADKKKAKLRASQMK
jgi:hypothetical protein